MKVEIRLITPEIARQLLANSGNNRPIRNDIVQRYADDMIAENWITSGCSIQFDTEGRLIDGQHRLAAICRARASLDFVLVTGVSRDAFAAIDTGLARSAGTLFTLDGKKSGPMRASICRWLYYLQLSHQKEVWYYNGAAISPQVLFEVHNEYWLHIEGYMGKRWRLLGAPLLAVLVFAELTASGWRSDLAPFAQYVETGLHEGEITDLSPCYWLREILIRNRAAKRKLSREQLVCLTAKAVKLHMNNDTTTGLHFKKGEKWPL